MANKKTRKYNKKRNTLHKTITVTKKTLKTVNRGLKESAPIVEKGVAGVYDTLATGFEMGIKGVNNVKNTISTRRKRVKTRHNKKRKSYHNRKKI